MGKLFFETSELLRRRPLLWLPVLIADLLGFLANLGGSSLVRLMVLHQTQFHSALGGTAMRASMTPAEMQHATIIALLISWCGNFVRVFVYAAAFVATAGIVRQTLEANTRKGQSGWGAAGAMLKRRLGPLFSLSVQALAIYAVFALLFGWFSRWALLHGHRTWITNGWFETGLSVLLVAALAGLLAPAGIYAIARQLPEAGPRRAAQILAFTLGVVALLIGHFIARNVQGVRIASAPARYAVEITGSWIAALPYAFAFVGVALVALRLERENAEAVTP